MKPTGDRIRISRVAAEDAQVLSAVARGLSIMAMDAQISPIEAGVRDHIEESEAFDPHDVPSLSFTREEAGVIKSALQHAIHVPHGYGSRGAFRSGVMYLASNAEAGISTATLEKALSEVTEFISA